MRFGRLAAVGAATAVLALVAGPASALTVDFSGTNPITATAKGDTVLTANGQELSCTNSSITANVNVGTTNPAADIIEAEWTDCSFGLFDAFVSVTIDPEDPWHLNAVSGMTTAANDHSIAGTITNIQGVDVLIEGPLGDCTFKVSGEVEAAFDEANGKGSQEVTVSDEGSDLLVSDRNSALACLNLVNDDDPATFAGDYNTDTSEGEINIKP